MSTSCAACAFFQASLLLPLHRRANTSCPSSARCAFEEAAPLKSLPARRVRRAWQEYKRMSSSIIFSQRFVQSVAPLRQALDEAGGAAKLLVLGARWQLLQPTCFRAARERTELIARARKDARLCFSRPQPSPRFYALSTFTPEQVRQDESTPGNRPSSFTEASAASSAYKKR